MHSQQAAGVPAHDALGAAFRSARAYLGRTAVVLRGSLIVSRYAQ